ncbi:MAG: DUF2490 domain-containing protein [Erythrobacter sp.]
MRLVSFCAAFVAALAPLPALAADESGSIWNAQFIKLNAGKDDRIFIRLESQQRLTQDATRLGQFILRPYVAYVINDDLNAGIGYAYFRTESGASPSGVIYEHRAFTEVNYRILNKPGIKIDTRTRLESRQWENIGDHSIRARSMVQVTIPVAPSGFGPVYFVEPFFNLNDQPNFPGGFEQIRNFGGVFIPVSKKVEFITGYMNLYQPRDGRDDRMDHVVWLKTFIKF